MRGLAAASLLFAGACVPKGRVAALEAVADQAWAERDQVVAERDAAVAALQRRDAEAALARARVAAIAEAVVAAAQRPGRWAGSRFEVAFEADACAAGQWTTAAAEAWAALAAVWPEGADVEVGVDAVACGEAALVRLADAGRAGVALRRVPEAGVGVRVGWGPADAPARGDGSAGDRESVEPVKPKSE